MDTTILPLGTNVLSTTCPVPGPFLVPEIQHEVFPIPSAASKRLKWSLNGPLESAIQVAPNPYYEPGDVMEPYFIPSVGDDLNSSWHPVSRESLMEPPVRDATVRIACVDDWEQLWVELNRYCTDTRTDPRRPRTKDVQLEVATGGEFLTVHEYVSAVHPWLMGLRERILHDLGKQNNGPPWPADSELVVVHFGRGPLYIHKEERWASSRRKRDPGASDRYHRLSAAEKEKRSQQAIERQLARSAARARELERLRQEKNN